jgi:hypothetical protein
MVGIMHEAVHEYLSKIGRKGGKIGGQSTLKTKIKAVMANLEVAHEARRKYTGCPRYKNHSHRFAKSGRCACGYQKP